MLTFASYIYKIHHQLKMARKYYEKQPNNNNKNSSYQKNNHKNMSNSTSTNNNKPQQTNQVTNINNNSNDQSSQPMNQVKINNLNKFAAFGKMMNNSSLSSSAKKPQQQVNESQKQLAASIVSNAVMTPKVMPVVQKQIGQLQKVNKIVPSGLVGQTIKSLKELQQLLDSYQQLQMDQNCNLLKNKANDKICEAK